MARGGVISSDCGVSERRRASARARAVLTATVMLASACVDPDEGGVPDPFVQDEATTTTGTSGQRSYPDGPYGVTRGAVIQDFAFSGFPAPDVETSELVPISLREFYNPKGDGVFPEGSPHGAGASIPRALGVVVGAVWCAPCQQEARPILPEEHSRLHPIGGEIFF